MGKGKGKKQPHSPLADRGAHKAPRSAFVDRNEKTPRGRFPNYGGASPLWAFRIVDFGGPWSWDGIDRETLRHILEKLKSFETMQWREIEAAGSHFLTDRSRLSKEARDRLVEIEQDDTDSLFSLRLTARRRIIGIRDGGTLKILWWDPEHQVAPSTLSHT